MINSNINRYITTIAKLQKTIGEQGETMKTLYKVMVLGGVLTISTMVMPVMAEDIATNQFVIPTTMPPLEPRIENPTFTVTDAPDAVVSSVKDGMENLPVYAPNNDTAPKEYLMVVEPHHKFQEPLKVRPETEGIVIHHVAIPSGDISSQAIHKAHLKNGWAGIGYHFVIRKDGTIERGRPLSVVGAHAQGDNLHTIGICMAGNFEKEYVGLSNIMHL